MSPYHLPWNLIFIGPQLAPDRPISNVSFINNIWYIDHGVPYPSLPASFGSIQNSPFALSRRPIFDAMSQSDHSSLLDAKLSTAYEVGRDSNSEPTEMPTPASKTYVPSKRTWKSYLWSTLDVPRGEAIFLTKLDLTLISSAALGVMIRYLDQVNITNAFNSGMKEDLNLYGNELNYANAFWSAAYVIGQIPSNLILTRVNAPRYIAFIELAWTAFTFGSAGVKNTRTLYALRFLIGLFEAGHFPAVMYVCSSYYKPHELARRNTLIQVFTSVGPLFSGFLMAAVFSSLDGKQGWAGWRWMFIVCGCISLPCALWTLFAMPQLPGRAKPNWLFSQEEINIARARMPTEAKLYTGLFKWKDIKRWHKTWHVYLFPFYFLAAGQIGQAGSSMIFWVRSYNVRGQPAVFSVAEINIIPLGINIITIVGALAASWISDALPGSSRWPPMVFASLVGVIIPAALGATPVHPANRGTRWALFYLTALSSTAAGVCWTYVNETSRDDPEKRAYVGAMMNAFSYIFTAFIPIFTFPTSKQPYVSTGMFATSGFAAAALLSALAIGYMEHRDKRKASRKWEEQQVVERVDNESGDDGKRSSGDVTLDEKT
ncbi:pantothenate transporter [Cryptococcus neoformans C23]|uniref:Pantothenate transporter n=2 Tax=Cryptococcus neoformans TaxID=5207 RepID=A0A854QFZ5_CRYNE|nr:pantothenate transporter [Cryptococcus neoformans var. grubii H99]AUB24323.1 pantothenate transporter [Cryptococcus neoformans var. grubii]OWZ32095.1 pantothenate transporter [Cryptococcus neoformans var. grubii AD2-60a]OWZ44763.1 pantothenate transporter [Cryptococcus neoformans var. grubii C23]OXG22814.1 pantothenate transporter [Cryptococcus neoformans var. grubii Tu259-1]OXG51187.1 pantothenate transporter [Cryptococcus neoformans var. grubii Th84]OXG83047.1 pantothenate transporter [C|eukprot:XP_012048906.1 pantothenate transporter [Cryptococcus neoformans var. grubii H99]